MARAAAARNVDAWHAELEAGGWTPWSSTPRAGGTVVKDYARLFANHPARWGKAAAIAAIARDVTELLAPEDLHLPETAVPLAVAYHDACSLQHAQMIRSRPRALLRAAGFDVRDVPEGHFCCGSAGAYNMLQPEMAEALGQRKAGHIESTGAAAVAAGNLGCLAQLGCFTGLPMLHTVDLLDWATGGPLPAALNGLDLPDPVARTPATAMSDAPAGPPPQDASSGRFARRRHLVEWVPTGGGHRDEHGCLSERRREWPRRRTCQHGGGNAGPLWREHHAGWRRRPAAVLYPGSTDEVSALSACQSPQGSAVPTSTGNNMGLGTRSAPATGMAVLDLGRRMNRILEIDDRLGFAAVEPGVSFQMLADELKRRGGQWMNSTTSGPPRAA